ncbi:LysE family translocator [Kurthia sibirica]|nr:LysE family translocator [Kurthia sibirica]GEK33944.1 putative membrane protein YrhP [Kurthia sibirica]
MNEIWMFALVALMIVMVPGVDSLLVLKNTLSYGKKAGVFTMIGIVLALVIWTTLAVLGLATIIAKSVVIFLAIKYLGAAYLIYLGIQAWRSKAQNMQLQTVAEPEPGGGRFSNKSFNCLTQGLTTDLLNPKTLLLYVTLMPQFIEPSHSVNMQLIVLATVLIMIAVVWLGIVVFIITIIRKWFLQERIQVIFNKLTAVVLVGIGVKLATEKIS